MKKLCSLLVWTLCFSLMSGHVLAQDAKVQKKEQTAQEKRKQIADESSATKGKKEQSADESSPIVKNGDLGAIKIKSSFNLFNNKGASLFYVGEEGKIGLGTTNPTEKLTLDGFIQFTSGGIKFPDGTILSSAKGSGGGGSLMNGGGRPWKTGGNDIDGSDFLGTTNAFDLIVKTNDVERMRILTNGNVGIGTSAPAQKLDVSGTAQMTGFILPTGAASGKVLTSDVTGVGTWQTLPSAGNAWSLTGNAGTDPSVNFIGTTGAQDFVIRTLGVERMRVTTTGTVGIGTNSPGGGVLNVVGATGSGQFISLTGGTGTVFNGGAAFISGGAGTGPASNGGDAELRAGPAQGGGTGGTALVTSGRRLTGGVDDLSALSLGGPNASRGGTVSLNGGNHPLQGGNVSITAGEGSGPGGVGGSVFITSRTGVMNAGNIVLHSAGISGGLRWTGGDGQVGGSMVYTAGTGNPTNGSFQFLNGNMGIGTTSPSEKLHVIGNGLFTGNVTASCGVLSCSDLRYKKDITSLSSPLQNVLALRGVNYYWRANDFPEMHFVADRQIGVIAQEVEKLYPEVVFTDKDGYKSVDYAKLTPVLIEAIKEQQNLIETLKQESAQLKAEATWAKSEVGDVKSKMARLESTMQRLEALMSARENSGMPSSASISQRNN